MKAEKIIGAWRLIAFEYKAEDGTTFAPLGKDPDGLVIFDRSGYMSGMMAKKDRPLLSTNDVSRIPEKEKAAISDGYIGYSGKYKMYVDKIVHKVEISFIPNWVGESLERAYQFSEKRMTLITPPTNFNGKEYKGYLTWERMLQH